MKIFTSSHCPLQGLANHHDLPQAARAALADKTTIHYEIGATNAAHMIEDNTPLPFDAQASISWPHQVSTCIHYEPPIHLNLQPGEQPDYGMMRGMIVIPQPDQSTANIITLGLVDGKPHFQQDTIDTMAGLVVPDDEPDGMDSDESDRIVRYYTRLARYITRSLQAPAPNPTGATKKAAAYIAENVKPGDPRPQLEEIIDKAAQNPRPFDVVLVTSRWVLGTENEADNAMARLQEHGIEVEFADERIE